MPKIISLQDTGRTWKEFHILEVQFDNNDGGTVLAKSPSPAYKVGEDVQYEKNERGGVKIQRDPSNYASTSTPLTTSNYSNNSPSARKDPSEQIARSVVFKGAIDLVSNGKLQITDIPSFVEKYLPVVTAEQPKGDSYQAHFQESSPF
jgi:hypothetical protein